MKFATPLTKAWIATFFFTIIGVVGLYNISDYVTSLPLIIFYAILVPNTFFSIKLFSSIIPQKNILQMFIDGVLIFFYFMLAVNLKSPLHFVFIALLIFIFATAKYSFLLGIVKEPLLLKRKILVDLSGVLACTLSASGIVFGYEMASTWALAIAFVVANIILFFVWPLYRLD